jgi:hypothetical protein
LEDFPRGCGIDGSLEFFAANALLAQTALGSVRSEPLVDEPGSETKAAFKPLRKAARKASQGVFRAIGVGRNTDDELDRLPFLEQRRDGRKAGAIILGADRGERVRDPDRQVTYRNPDAFFTEVECQNRSASGHRNYQA